MLAPAVVVLLLIGLPGNLRTLAHYKRMSNLTPIQALVQSRRRTNTPAVCEAAPVNRRLDKGQSLRIKGGPVLVFAAGGAVYSLVFDPTDGTTLTALVGPLRFRMAPADRMRSVAVCGGST